MINEMPIKTKKQYWLYVLNLEQGKYYIGLTSQKFPSTRIKQHIVGFNTAQWVRKYRFVKVKEIINVGVISKNQALELEDKRTLQYMKKYGYNNVRGGSFCYSGNYKKLGNRYVTDKDWVTLQSIAFIMACMFTAYILK